MGDEQYILDLCDAVLGHPSMRQHRFAFLRSDAGTPLPVDAYYPALGLVIEYRERQHTEAVPFFDRRMTASGLPRGQQRARYDARRRVVLPQHGLALVELSYADFAHTAAKRLVRDSVRDRAVLWETLAAWLKAALAPTST